MKCKSYLPKKTKGPRASKLTHKWFWSDFVGQEPGRHQNRPTLFDSFVSRSIPGCCRSSCTSATVMKALKSGLAHGASRHFTQNHNSKALALAFRCDAVNQEDLIQFMPYTAYTIRNNRYRQQKLCVKNVRFMIILNI